jgi:Flp pilus assembly pilin Flp
VAKRKKDGQEAVEFTLLAVLIFMAGVFVVSLLGNKLASFFKTDSSVAKTANATTEVLSAANPVKYSEGFTTTMPVATVKLGGYDVTENADGSVSFNVNGQDVTLSKDMLDLQNTVLQTTGTSGAETLVKEVAYMINKYQSAYSGSSVPVQISYGTGKRASGSTSYSGEAVVNTTSIKVGNNLVVLQYDQTCTGQCTFDGLYRMEGQISSNNTFSAKVTSTNIDYNPYGTYSSKVSVSDTGAIDFTNGKYLQSDSYNGTNGMSYNWNLNFDDTTKSYSA